jgi:hypothetical protein
VLGWRNGDVLYDIFDSSRAGNEMAMCYMIYLRNSSRVLLPNGDVLRWFELLACSRNQVAIKLYRYNSAINVLITKWRCVISPIFDLACWQLEDGVCYMIC